MILPGWSPVGLGDGSVGTAQVNLLHNFIVGAFGGSNGIVNQTGGTITAADNVFVGRDGSGAWTMSGGTVTAPNTLIANVGAATGTLSLNGGVVQTANLTGGEGTSTLELNGGTVRATADNPTWVGSGAGIDTIRVQAGGVVFDTNGFNTGIAVVLPHDPGLATADGGVTKTGAGTLTLSAANTYNGGTRVQAGTLRVTRLHENNPVNITGGKLQVMDSSPTLPDHPSGVVFTNAFNNGAGSTVNITQAGGTFNTRIAFVLGQGNGTTTMDHSGGVINALENNGDMVVGDGDFNTSTYNVSGHAARGFGALPRGPTRPHAAPRRAERNRAAAAAASPYSY